MFLIDMSAKQANNGLGLESFLRPKCAVLVKTTSSLNTDEKSSQSSESSEWDSEDSARLYTIKFLDLRSLSANLSRMVSVAAVEGVEMDETVSVWFEAVEDSDTEFISIWRFSLLVTRFAIFVDNSFTDCVSESYFDNKDSTTVFVSVSVCGTLCVSFQFATSCFFRLLQLFCSQ